MKLLSVLLGIAILSSCRDLVVAEPTGTPIVTEEATPTESPTEQPTATITPIAFEEYEALYEAQAIVDYLIIRNSDGSESEDYLHAGDYVTVVREVDDLEGFTVPEVWGGQWCLIEPQELGDYVACQLLQCTRNCTE